MFVFRTLHNSGKIFFAATNQNIAIPPAQRFCAANVQMVEYFAPPPHNHLHLAQFNIFCFLSNNIWNLKTINLYKMWAMRYPLWFVFWWFLQARSQNILPMVGTDVRFFYNNQNESHILSEASTEPGMYHSGQLQPAGKKAPLFMASLEYTGAKHQTCGHWLGRVLANKCRISFFSWDLPAYTFNRHIKSWSGGIGLRADVVLFEKSQGRYELIIMGREQKTKIFTSLIPGFYKDLKLDQVSMWRRRYSGWKNAIKPFLTVPCIWSDEVKFSIPRPW